MAFNWEKAQNYAHDFHANHKRISGFSYFDHIEAVVKNLKMIQVEDDSTLTLAYLKHILVFDASKEEEISHEFGKETLELLKKYITLAKNTIKDISPKNLNEHLILQAYINLAHDYRILLVRLATKVENVETSVNLPKEQAERVAERALYLYAPLARMMSLGNFASRLEDAAFKILYPAHFKDIIKKIRPTKRRARVFFDSSIPPLKQLLEENGVPCQIKGRIKHPYGIFRKSLAYQEKGKPAGDKYQNILDIVGLRVITDTLDNCYKAEDLIKQLWEFLPEERDDYIQKPKPSGYKSIHNIFKVTKDLFMEVQIRTTQMHEENEFGKASHLLYKTGNSLKESVEKNPGWLKEISQPNNISQVQTNPFSNKVYSFTPKGDIIELPRGANLIDFSYAIHAKIGNSAVGGMVNGIQEKLSYEIKDGDRIEIRTAKNKGKPSEDWLKMVKTAKARHAIRKILRVKNF